MKYLTIPIFLLAFIVYTGYNLPMKSIARSSKDVRTGEQYSRTIDRTATVKSRPFGGTTVKLNRNVTNYKDMSGGGRKAVTTKDTGYKKVYKSNGTLKKIKTY